MGAELQTKKGRLLGGTQGLPENDEAYEWGNEKGKTLLDMISPQTFPHQNIFTPSGGPWK